jgi:hypothetical protein
MYLELSITERSPTSYVRSRRRVSSLVPEKRYCISLPASTAAPITSTAGRDRCQQPASVIEGRWPCVK